MAEDVTQSHALLLLSAIAKDPLARATLVADNMPLAYLCMRGPSHPLRAPALATALCEEPAFR